MNYLGLYLRNSLRKGVAEQHKWKSSSVCHEIASVFASVFAFTFVSVPGPQCP